MQYAMVVVAACVPGYLIAGFTENWLITLVSSLLSDRSLLYLRRRSLAEDARGVKKAVLSKRKALFFVGATIGRPQPFAAAKARGSSRTPTPYTVGTNSVSGRPQKPFYSAYRPESAGTTTASRRGIPARRDAQTAGR